MPNAEPTRLVAGCRTAHFATRVEADDLERVLGSVLCVPTAHRRCVLCGGTLSIHNPGDRCLRHANRRYRTLPQTPRLLCRECGVTALSDGNRTCKACLRRRRAEG